MSSCYNLQDYDCESLTEQVKNIRERYLLTGSTTIDYLQGGSTWVSKQVAYDSNYPLVTENIINDGSKIISNN